MTQPALADPSVQDEIQKKRASRKVVQYFDAKANDGRRYMHPHRPDPRDGSDFYYVYSVTNALSVLDKPGLRQWAVDQTAAYYAANPEASFTRTEASAFNFGRWAHKYQLDAAAYVGDRIHNYAESTMDWAVEAPDLETEEELQMAERWHELLDEHWVNPIFTEATVWNDVHHYAGTFDLLAELDGTLTLIDNKTSRNLWTEHLAQLIALGNATSLLIPRGPNEWEEVEMPRVDNFAIFHIRPDDFNNKGDFVPSYQEVIKFTREELEPYFELFLSALGVKTASDSVKKHFETIKKGLHVAHVDDENKLPKEEQPW